MAYMMDGSLCRMEIKQTNGSSPAQIQEEQGYTYKYPKPSVTVDTLVFTVAQGERVSYRNLPSNTLQILLIKRKHAPFEGTWALPGGFVEIAEDLRVAARRELLEETGIEPSYFGQLYTYGDVDRDPRDRVISTAYLAVVNKNLCTLKAGDDAKEAAWFDLSCKLEKVEAIEQGNGMAYHWHIRLLLDNGQEKLSALLEITRLIEGSTIAINRVIIENEGLAFDHARIIEYGVEMLRHKIKYTDLVFKLVPEYFTLTELQKVYETILDQTIPRASFRRNMADRVLETERYVKKGGHRPSQLFMFNPHWLERPLQEGVVDLWS